MNAAGPIALTSASSPSAPGSRLPLRQDSGDFLPSGVLVFLAVLAIVGLLFARRFIQQGPGALPGWLVRRTSESGAAIELAATRRLNARVSLAEVSWSGRRLLLAVEDGGAVSVLHDQPAVEEGA